MLFLEASSIEKIIPYELNSYAIDNKNSKLYKYVFTQNCEAILREISQSPILK